MAAHPILKKRVGDTYLRGSALAINALFFHSEATIQLITSGGRTFMVNIKI